MAKAAAKNAPKSRPARPTSQKENTAAVRRWLEEQGEIAAKDGVHKFYIDPKGRASKAFIRSFYDRTGIRCQIEDNYATLTCGKPQETKTETAPTA